MARLADRDLGIGLVLNGWDVYLRRPITNADVEREITRLHMPH